MGTADHLMLFQLFHFWTDIGPTNQLTMDRRTDQQMDQQTDQQMDGPMDGPTDGPMDGPTDAQSL